MEITIERLEDAPIDAQPVEIVERKGRGRLRLDRWPLRT